MSDKKEGAKKPPVKNGRGYGFKKIDLTSTKILYHDIKP